MARASKRPYDGLPEITYPFHDKDVLVTACGRNYMHRKKINVSTVLAGQRLGIREMDDGIWLVSFMHYDLGKHPVSLSVTHKSLPLAFRHLIGANRS